MNMNIHLMVTGICLLDAVLLTKGQDCANYLLIADSCRTTKQVFNNGTTDSPISDKDLDPTKWYRFQSYVGNMIPERAEGESVELNRCGTVKPIYISGLDQHPNHDNESRTAIVKLTDWQAEISIHRCPPGVDNESFYIYLLAPAFDQTAYCAGDGEPPCQEGYAYNGIECVDYFPIMKGPPIFSGPHTTGSNEYQQIYFKCQVQYDRTPYDSFARFMITFVFDGLELENIESPHRHLPPFIVGPDGDLSANLTEYYLQGRLGKEIRCKVRSFWDENCEKGQSMMSREKYKATLEAVEIFYFDFTNGETQRVPFHPTLPFTNYHCSVYPGKCPPTFAYYFNLVSVVATDAQCAIQWMSGTVPELSVYIKPFAGSRIFEIKFEPYQGDHLQNSSSLWHNFIIPTVTIMVSDSSEKMCNSGITTFDGRYYYAHSYDGDYYLVLGEADQHKLEIQVRKEVCNYDAACICGVIVREINSAVKVGYNVCGQWDTIEPRPISVTLLLTQYPDDGTEINRDETGRIFSIRTPSGTRVEVDANVPYFTIRVHLAPIYHGKTSVYSLCGNSNGVIDDDSTDDYLARIQDPAKSYFNVQPECYGDITLAAKTCECADYGSAAECTNVEQNITMKSPANIELSTVWSSGVVCVASESPFLSKHSSCENNADHILDPADLFPPFLPKPNAGHNLTRSWPTPKGKTEEEVKKHCLNMLAESPVYSDCKTVVNTDLTVLECVSNIQIADEYIATTSYVNSFGQECINILIAQESNSTRGSSPPAVDVTTIYNKICPAQCSDQGTCKNATCFCNAGYIGADCSIDETQPPVLTGIVRSGFCDIQQRPCAAVSVFGYGFVSSKTLKCRFTSIDGGSAVDTIGIFVTGSEVSCSVPNITTERPAIRRQGISVANDGALYSNVLEFVTFDSVCMSCGQDKVCIQKTDACLIRDRCYANGAMKDTQTCLQCSPSQSISSWTNMPGFKHNNCFGGER